MTTPCTKPRFTFPSLNRRVLQARFDGGAISSDGGALLLYEVERRLGVIRRFAACFTDHRAPERIEHGVESLIAQRLYGLALGYEDLNDHDDLRFDPLLATLAGKDDPTGQQRARRRDRGKALAGKSTLNRLELTPPQADARARYKKIVCDEAALAHLFVDLFLDHSEAPTDWLILDLDATDILLHGQQEGRFFHGYYGNYCYLPLYIFCGEHLLCSQLRPADLDGAHGSDRELERIVNRIRARRPDVKILVRGDSGFCREWLMKWCEDHDVDYLFGLAKNARLVKMIEVETLLAHYEHLRTGQAARVFAELRYQTRESWSRERRVIAKAEHLEKGANPRFVVTSLPPEVADARALYEDWYCARGEMENHIKEVQLELFADRASTHWLRSNQLRLWFSSAAYVLLHGLRRLALPGTELARAQCGTIRTKLLKIGARVVVSVRRVLVSLSEACPYQAVFAQAVEALAGGVLIGAAQNRGVPAVR